MKSVRLRQPAIQFTVLLLVALVLRADTFGDPNLHGDEAFYHTIGVAMHHGALPYVDVWDRKPFGLFALYYLFAFISEAPLSYQLAAALFAATTAWIIALIVRRLARDGARPAGGLLVGIAYLLWLGPLQGFGGQSPVFYNLFIALAAWLVLDALPELRKGRIPASTWLAMLSAGTGITIKTTAMFEAAFLGMACVAALARSPARIRTIRWVAASWALTGALPVLAIASSYAAFGYSPEYWHAMATSNLNKALHWPTALFRLRLMLLALSPIITLGLLGLLKGQARESAFLWGWLAASLAGLCIVPNFYLHYALPLLVPLCVAAGGLLSRGSLGGAAVAALAALSFTISPPFRFERAERSREAIEALVQAVRRQSGDGPLFLYDAPPQLYVLTGQPFPTPLVFPTHLSHLIEKDVSHLSTMGETRRVLASRPGLVIMAVRLRNGPGNDETRKAVLQYVARNCRLITTVKAIERQRADWMAVWGRCRANRRPDRAAI